MLLVSEYLERETHDLQPLSIVRSALIISFGLFI